VLLLVMLLTVLPPLKQRSATDIAQVCWLESVWSHECGIVANGTAVAVAHARRAYVADNDRVAEIGKAGATPLDTWCAAADELERTQRAGARMSVVMVSWRIC
jgi:hypothetical protein